MATRRRGAGEGSIFQRKDGRWVGQLDAGIVDGRRRYRTVYGKQRKDVVERLTTLLHEQQTGTLPNSGRLTVREYLETWLAASAARVRESTLARYRGIITRQILPAIGRVNLAKLQPVQVAKMLADLHRSGLSARTCHHTRAVLRAALHDAQRDGLIVRNAASLAREPKVESYRVEPMTPSQARAILDAFADTDLEPLVAAALWTGLRQSELLGLRWGDVDLAASRLTVRVTLQRRAGTWHVQPTKTDKSRRTVPLPEPLVEILSEHRQRQREAQLRAQYWETSFGDLVFTSDYGRPVMAATLSHRFHELQVSAGLIAVRFHDLRHAAATLMLASGTDLKVVSELLGHSTIATTANVYAGVLDSLKVDAAERMTRLLSR